MSSALRLTDGVDLAIREHGRDAYPHECCGALIGRDGIVTSTSPLPNVTDEGPRRRFRVSDKDYLAVQRAADAAGDELIGFYHSHPDHPAVPSQYDLDHAFPSFAYVIVSVVAGEAGDLRSWTLRDDRSAFDEQTVEVSEPSPFNLQP
jgi:proteasome lid subunit RPN8/RPN11